MTPLSSLAPSFSQVCCCWLPGFTSLDNMPHPGPRIGEKAKESSCLLVSDGRHLSLLSPELRLSNAHVPPLFSPGPRGRPGVGPDMVSLLSLRALCAGVVWTPVSGHTASG